LNWVGWGCGGLYMCLLVLSYVRWVGDYLFYSITLEDLPHDQSVIFKFY
jgi:hypothetical protein